MQSVSHLALQSIWDSMYSLRVLEVGLYKQQTNYSSYPTVHHSTHNIVPLFPLSILYTRCRTHYIRCTCASCYPLYKYIHPTNHIHKALRLYAMSLVSLNSTYHQVSPQGCRHRKNNVSILTATNHQHRPAASS
jgi:hypothetical protein